MALKPDRQIDASELGYYLNETASPGVVVSISTSSSGSDLDGSANLVTVAAAASGAKPLGVLLDEFVNIDVTRFHLNFHKGQRQVGDKASIVTRGWVVTDKVTGTPSAGDTAVLTASGSVTNGTHGTATPKVGRFLSKKDADGYIRLAIETIV